MADLKISQLPAATVPLAGTELVPIVQSGITEQVTVANLTAGRAVSASQLTLTAGNLIVANGQGIDFSATPGTGTSELLADYEEGTWTPVANVITYASGTSGFYTKIGRSVICTFTIVFPVTSDTARAQIQALPFASAVNTAPTFGVYTSNFNGYVTAGNAIVTLINETGSAFTTNVTLSGQTIYGTIVYSV